MSRPLFLVKILKKIYWTRFAIARATHLPLVGRLIDRIVFHGDRMVYLPNDRVIPVGEAISLPGEMVLPSRVVEHFVEQADKRWIMDRCLCRDGNHCQDYPVDLGCIFLGEAVTGINPKLGRLVSKEEALAHLDRARELGLVHIVGRNKLDTLWLGVGPGQNLLTICHCCPCCCLFGILPHLTPEISATVTAMPGVQVRVTDACIGCGACQDGVCFVDAIHVTDGQAVIGPDCRGCGRCVQACPQEAIELTIADWTFVEKTIQDLAAVVDVVTPPAA